MPRMIWTATFLSLGSIYYCVSVLLTSVGHMWKIKSNNYVVSAIISKHYSAKSGAYVLTFYHVFDQLFYKVVA